MKSRALPPILIFCIALFALLPYTHDPFQHGDEKFFSWKAWYLSSKILALNFRKGDSASLDPGFAPYSIVALEHPFGSHIIYGSLMQLAKLPPAPLLYSYTDPEFQGIDTEIPARTLLALRITAVTCAALGLALISLKFQWQGAIATLLFLVIPHVRSDLFRAWAEGPLLLGIGICVISYGTRIFPIACGLVAAFKLTGLGIWPLMLLKGANGRWVRMPILGPIVTTLAIFTALNPIAWFSAGPAYLFVFIWFRIYQYQIQTREYGGFFPSRYAWPFELLALLFLAHAFPRLLKRAQAKRFMPPLASDKS